MFTKKQISYFSIPLLLSGVIIFFLPKSILSTIALIIGLISILILWLGNYKPKVGLPFLWKINKILNKENYK